MLCEICGIRYANVHDTRVLKVQGLSVTGAERHLCEVCAGLKTEQQFLEEEVAQQQERAVRSKHYEEMALALGQLVDQEILSPRAEIMKEKQLVIRTSAVSPDSNLYFIGLSSPLPEVNPIEALLGPSFQGNHATLPAGICDVHLIRWDSDPRTLLRYVFEPFPNAGVRLDDLSPSLFVEAERDLLPDAARSVSFCYLAASMLNTCDPEAARIFPYRYTPTRQSG